MEMCVYLHPLESKCWSTKEVSSLAELSMRGGRGIRCRLLHESCHERL